MEKKQKKFVFLSICFVLVFFIYGYTLSGDFVFDDRSIASHYPIFKDINNLPEVAVMGYWTEESGLYRPVVLISYALNSAFFGPFAFSFHLINLILYAFIGYLLYLLIRIIFPKKEKFAYLFSILFLVLPIHTEVVANIVGRAEILALLFSLLTFLELSKSKSNLWKAGLWFLLALGSKEVAVAVLPISLFIIFYKNKCCFNKKNIGDYFSPLIILFTSAFVYFSIRFLVLGQYFFSNNATLTENPLKFVSFGERIATGFKILFLYIKKSLFGFNLCSDYSYNQIPISKSFFNLETLLGLGLFLFFIFSLIFFLKKAPILALGSAFFLFPFLPVSNLFFAMGTIMGERLMFFPSVGICLYLAQGLIWLYKIKNNKFIHFLFVVLIIGLICFYGAKSFIRSFDWLTEEKLFISAAQCAPHSVLSRSNMGTVYYFEGKYKEAEEEILEAHKIYDKYSKAVNNLGLIYWKKEEYDKAQEQYFKAIKNWPPYEGVYENLILLYLSQGQTEKARKWINAIFISDQESKDIYLKRYGLK
ncbi:hypothetical protein KKH96_02545 [Patescibacteria group bacterium]|nr:hypothetical protein [Patescibacteria group bacterium]